MYIVPTVEQIECMIEYYEYLNQIGKSDTEFAINYCSELNAILNAPTEEPNPINNGIEILEIYVPTNAIVPGKLIAQTRYRFAHDPPHIIAPDLKHGWYGNDNIISEKNKKMLNWPRIDLENKMVDLLHFATNSQYKPIADKFFARFKAGLGGFYNEADVSNSLMETIEIQNKIKEFGNDFEIKLKLVKGDLEKINLFTLEDIRRFILSRGNGYLLMEPTILINDVSQAKYHIQSFSIDDLGNWEGLFYIETIDHFGLDDDDPNHKIQILDWDITIYQHIHS